MYFILLKFKFFVLQQLKKKNNNNPRVQRHNLTPCEYTYIIIYTNILCNILSTNIKHKLFETIINIYPIFIHLHKNVSKIHVGCCAWYAKRLKMKEK